MKWFITDMDGTFLNDKKEVECERCNSKTAR